MKKLILAIFICLASGHALAGSAVERINRQMMGGHTTASQTATFRCALPGVCSSAVSGLDDAMPAPTSGTISGLQAWVKVAPGAGKSWTVEVYVGGSATALTCTISDTNLTCSDSTNTVAFTKGQNVGVRFTAAGSPTGSQAAGYSVSVVTV